MLLAVNWIIPPITSNSYIIQIYHHNAEDGSFRSHFVHPVNILRPMQDGQRPQDDIFKWIFFNKNCCILITISPKYIPKGPIDNQALV